MHSRGGPVAGMRELLLDGFLRPQQKRGLLQRTARVVRPRVPAGGRWRRGARPRVRAGSCGIRFSIRSSGAGLQPLAPQLFVEGGVQVRAVGGPGSGVVRRRLRYCRRPRGRSRLRFRRCRRFLVVELLPPIQQRREDVFRHERHDLLAELAHVLRVLAGRHACPTVLEVLQRQHQQLAEQVVRLLPAEPRQRLAAVAVELLDPRREQLGLLLDHGRVDELDEERKRRGVVPRRFRRGDGSPEALEALLSLGDGVAGDGHQVLPDAVRKQLPYSRERRALLDERVNPSVVRLRPGSRVRLHRRGLGLLSRSRGSPRKRAAVCVRQRAVGEGATPV